MLFELDVTDAAAARAAIEGLGAAVVHVAADGPAGGNPCLMIAALDEAAAFAVVDAVYDALDLNVASVRQPNSFDVYV